MSIVRLRRIACCGALALALAACDRTAIVQGTVTDVSGEMLPGVAVTILGQELQDTTAGVGTYRMRCVPGALELAFEKTGYTPGRLLITAGSGTTQAEPVMLWPLPTSRGVFLFREFRYQDTDRTEPKRYQTRELGLTFGLKKDITQTTLDTNPVIICHRMPTYDVHIHVLQLVEASDPELETPDYSQKVWAPVSEVPFASAPIDQPDQLLVELRPGASLEPGAYAVDWGALDGYTSTDSRVFLFRVISPDEPAPEPEPAPEEPAQPSPEKKTGLEETPAADEAPA